ncbi:MAG: type III restriction enzyme, res subunit [Hyperionvirus sp.]|uniref:Type III restriction enzyme, res subunit n=1 Tax=Hyperionvirus sp. TaxID=2487770 RepID=A0A3G5AAU3_9VIRU|nr:MAG: type III restriction enzyme, res subunit [Hyperionvirus sp.]
MNQLEVIKRRLDEIFKDFVKHDSDNCKGMLMDEYNIDSDAYDFIRDMDEKWVQCFHDMIDRNVHKNLSYEEIIGKFKWDTQKGFYKYLFHDILEEDKPIIIDDPDMAKEIETFKWRTNQEKAIIAMEKGNFKSGLNCQIMGSGKTYIMLRAIARHYEIHKKPKTYIIMCSRKEILEKMFYSTDEDETRTTKARWKEWKEHKVIDMDKFDFIDCVTTETTREIDLVSGDKPKIVIINNDYVNNKIKLTDGAINFPGFTAANIPFVLLDECHSVSAKQFHKVLHAIKYKLKIPIIGFSATPIRDKNKKSMPQIKDIFSISIDEMEEDKKVNIYSIYDMIDAIKDDVILPPRIIYIEGKKCKQSPGKLDVDGTRLVIKSVLDDIIPELPYMKLIMWAKNVRSMEDWAKYIKAEYGDFTVYCTSYLDKIDKKNPQTPLDKYYLEKEYAILICVNKCKEGSDIPYIDCGVDLDGVKNGSLTASLQKKGRLMRPDKEGKKERAVIIETFISEENQNQSHMTIEKVLEYYKVILGLQDEKTSTEFYEKYLELINNTDFDPVKKEITINIDKNEKHQMKMKFVLIQNDVDWGDLKKQIMKQVERNLEISSEEKFNMILAKIKELGIFTRESDFWKVYNGLTSEYKNEHNLPSNIYDEYKDIIDKKTWYDLLGYDTSIWYQNKNVMIKKIRNKIRKVNKLPIERIYRQMRKIDTKLPPYPQELYRLGGFINFEQILDDEIGYI